MEMLTKLNEKLEYIKQRIHKETQLGAKAEEETKNS